ncbi:DUF3052 domain-containing protein [Nocardioides marmorisolisilvae]|uniref:DUF3052 domain-containing protein n=1 Tax=Nocardioides marmorisolisilvae TaxID=1542737 RepID=A0A3N0DS74_9ACTN|nr:DUF3052 domain-containing protein [Nocardioides marmorisolisilvae]RNL78470.1 DUF3052 domain-containing protein [Nocardioides marmorisolisilvae]
MAGYSGNSLEKKLGVKDGQRVYLDGAPNGFFLSCPTTARLPKSMEISLTFHTSPERLAARLPVLIEHTTQAGMIWVCWPKKASAKLGYTSDLDENLVRQIGLDSGVVDVKVCAVDEIWSGLKFVRRLSDRT